MMRCGRLLTSVLCAVIGATFALTAVAAEVIPTPTEHIIPRAPGKVQVDGRLTEWKGFTPLTIDPTSAGKDPAVSLHVGNPNNPIRGAKDLSARVLLAWDDEHLYIAGQVTDDDLRGIRPDGAHNVGPAGWFCDSLMFQIHSFRKPLKTNNPFGKTPNLALRYEVRPGGRGKLIDNPSDRLGKADSYWKLPQGSRLATRETGNGYVVEAAVPWASFGFKPQAGETLFCGVMLGDIDGGENLNQLGWHHGGPRDNAPFRLLGRPEATGQLTLATEIVPVGKPWSMTYRVDARTAPVQVTRIVFALPKGKKLHRDVNVEVPKGKTAQDMIVLAEVPDAPGECEVRLEARIGGKTVVLAREGFAIAPPVPTPPLAQDPPQELYRMRPDRVAHSAEDDRFRKIVKHGYITGRKGYERYILTHVKDYTDYYMPLTLKSPSVYMGRNTFSCYVLYRITGEEKYAQWTQQGLAAHIALLKKKVNDRALHGLTHVLSAILRDDPKCKLVPAGAEKDLAKFWVKFSQEPPEWMFLEWGYHNRCWHRWGYAKLAQYFSKKADHTIDPRFTEYVDWHEEKLVKLGDTTDNSSGYHWTFFNYPVFVHMATGTMDKMAENPGYKAAINRYRQFASPSGAVPQFGDTSGWLTGAGAAMQYFELMAAVTRDGRLRWQAHRIAEYLYNHFWPRHEQYHGPKDSMASAFCHAWLWADDSVKPKPPSTASRLTMRPRVVDLPPEEEHSKPGLSYGKIIASDVPDKIILSSGNDPQKLWGLVEVLDKGGHCGQLPGHIASLMMRDSALLAGQGYYEKSQDFNNVVWVEDLNGIAADPRPVRTEIPRFVEDGLATYVRIRVRRYAHLPITAERDIVFVKNGFLLVKDRLTFHATMKLRVGPCWQTRNLGPQHGETWFNTYYDQLYLTGLGLGRGVHAYKNPAWDLLVTFGAREGCRQTVLDRYDDNPYRVSPVQLRQVWSGIVKPDQTMTFTSVLLPHAPAFDVRPFSDWVQFLVDTDETTVVRVTCEWDAKHHFQPSYYVQLHEGKGLVEAKGWASDARYVVVPRNWRGDLGAPLMAGGKTVKVDGTDLSAKARAAKLQKPFVLGKED